MYVPAHVRRCVRTYRSCVHGGVNSWGSTPLSFAGFFPAHTLGRQMCTSQSDLHVYPVRRRSLMRWAKQFCSLQLCYALFCSAQVIARASRCSCLYKSFCKSLCKSVCKSVCKSLCKSCTVVVNPFVRPTFAQTVADTFADTFAQTLAHNSCL